MSELVFDCLDAQPDRYGVAPTLVFRLRISETSGTSVEAIALRCQIRIEPQRRRYSPAEEEQLNDLFGETSRWGDTLKPFQFANVAQMVSRFVDSTEVDLPIACTYDMEVASAKYFASLGDGEIPLLLLFSGQVFLRGEAGISIEQVPWHKEAAYRLPVAVWRELMDIYFPGSAWIRLGRESLDRLQRYKSSRVLTGWDEALDALFKEAGVEEP